MKTRRPPGAIDGIFHQIDVLELRPGEAEIGQFVLKRFELRWMDGDANIGGVNGEGHGLLEILAHDPLVHGSLPLGDFARDGAGEADDFVDGIGLEHDRGRRRSACTAWVSDADSCVMAAVCSASACGVAGFFAVLEALGAAHADGLRTCPAWRSRSLICSLSALASAMIWSALCAGAEED